MILKPGVFLQERYEIIEKIGSGGMSDVYKAKCHKLNRLVAVKVLKEEFTSDSIFVGKFKMEAQAAAGLSHPNIVNIYDVVDEGELHYIVMELIEGITLKNYIEKKGYLDWKETIGIAIQVAQGIAAAHEQHIIHRDIKPQNMIISRDGKVKVADFGIARAVSSQTQNATVVGSVHYISPEQARGGYSDERSDIYSLGITMFEMATGRLPFDGENTLTVALAHLEDQIPLPSKFNPNITPSLERIILKCTEKKPDRRYRSAEAVIAELRRALLSPNDPTIGEEEQFRLSQTITISPKELDIIKTRSGSQPDGRPERAGRERREHWEEPRRSASESGDLQQRRYPSPSSREGKMRNRHENGASSQLEKILTTLGVVVAILIVAVVIVFISNLSGVFNRPSGRTETETTDTSAEPSSSEQETTTISAKEVQMPKVVGDTEDVAEEKLREVNLVMQVTQENSDEVEKGVVISQENAPGSVVSRYSKVNVVVSAGSDKIDLESMGLTSMTLETAVRLLEGKGLKTAIIEEASETVDKGSIIRYEPVGKAALGDTVTFIVSTGPKVETVPVPKLVGETEETALGLLQASELIPGQVSQEHSAEVPEGSIISQGIPEGEQAEKGAAIDYVVSLGPEQPKTQFLASLEASYPLIISYGPGAANSEIQVVIRLKQIVNGAPYYQNLTKPKTYTADTTLDIRFSQIRGADGVLTGEVEIVDLTNNVVLNSYNVSFVEVPSS